MVVLNLGQHVVSSNLLGTPTTRHPLITRDRQTQTDRPTVPGDAIMRVLVLLASLHVLSALRGLAIHGAAKSSTASILRPIMQTDELEVSNSTEMARTYVRLTEGERAFVRQTLARAYASPYGTEDAHSAARAAVGRASKRPKQMTKAERKHALKRFFSSGRSTPSEFDI